MATSVITTPVTMPFTEYKWLWATWTVREIFKSIDVFPKSVKIMYKYNDLPYGLGTTTGKNFHDDLLALNLTDESGSRISFVDASNRSFLRGYQPYWTNTGILSPPSLNSNKIVVTPLGKALATGKVSFSEYIKIIASRFQFPNLITQYNGYQSWLSHGVVFKPFVYTLKVLVELYKQGGFANSYISEQEMALILVPLVPIMTPVQVANEIIAWREGDPSFNLSNLYTDFATTANAYRNIKEFLQLLSIGGFLVNTNMHVKSFSIGTGTTTSTSSKSNCYFLNTFTDGKWGQSTSSTDMLPSIESFCEEAEKSGYFAYNSLLSEKDHKLKFVEYLGTFNSPTVAPATTSPEINSYIDLLKTHKQIIFAGAPGIGKTRVALEIANALQSNGELAAAETILFHQASNYEDFIEGIRPSIDSANLSYSYKTGKFKLLCEKARLNAGQYYLLIIDEINRGNISSIFGELIFLLEPSYRKPEYQIELQYTGDYFWVPDNVLIIGTMNTIDKSAVELDLALRRRFKFIYLHPDSNVIKEELQKFSITINDPAGNPLDIPKAHENFNNIIADDAGLGEDFCIGHSFFLPKPDTDYDEGFLLDIWNFSLIPLLNEYILLSPRFKTTLIDYGFNINRGRITDFDLPNMYNTMAQLSR
ncbi:AlwI family type II restriction endonuclease [Neobacillus sp. BF23-41]|uniref:AlwI family type II restriction endonuclease n=1 Tax=Neobacillus sp. BF23-41 TaxID=3240280 RepID=UPI0034E4135A